MEQNQTTNTDSGTLLNDAGISPESTVDWVDSIRIAFEPYARFVGEVSEGLASLERIHQEMVPLEESSSQLRSKDELLLKREERISELANELERLKLELSFRTLKKAAPETLQFDSESNRAPSGGNRKKAVKEGRALSPKRVLLLDPVELNRVLMSHYFKGLPVTIEYVRSPAEAMRELEQPAKQGPFDLLLVDLDLKIEGEWISWIRGKSGHISVVACCPSHASSEAEEKARSLGFDGVLARSEPKTALVEKLEAILWPF